MNFSPICNMHAGVLHVTSQFGPIPMLLQKAWNLGVLVWTH